MLLKRVARASALVAMCMIATGCSWQESHGPDELLREMRVDSSAYAALDTCLQVRVFTDVGERTLSIHHGIVRVPNWMNDTLAGAPRDAVAECMGQEGMYRLRLLDARLSTREEVSRAVHVLLLKAAELKIVSTPPVEQFAREAVCTHDLDESPVLVLTFWYGSGREAPQTSDVMDLVPLMRTELCR